MSEARTKPSRVVRQVAFTVADLPAAANNSLTASITGLPSRGIIRRVTAHIMAGQAFPTVASSVDGLFVHRVGTDGKNQVSVEHAKSMVCAYALDLQTGGLAGSASLFTTTPGNRAILSRILSPASSGVGGYTAIDGGSVASGPITAATVGPVNNSVAYDIYGADAGVASTAKVLGPNADQATLHFTVISGGTNFTTVAAQGMWIEVEIEPCF